MNTFVIVGILGTFALFAVILVTRRIRSRKLHGLALQCVQNAWRTAGKQTDPVRRIIEADNVLDEALKRLGYTGSLGEKLKAAGPRFSDLQSLWSAHKLRNRVVHAVGATVTQQEADAAFHAIHRALSDLGMR